MKLIAFMIATTFLLLVKELRLRIKAKRDIGTDAILDNEFLSMRKSGELKELNTAGAYIITNLKNRKSYVGQSVKIVDRVNSHLTGSGNGDIYADIQEGVRFSVKLVPIYGTHYKDLNSLERFLIGAYNSYKRGYNKTRGNR